MPKPKKDVKIFIDTIEDFQYNPIAKDYFSVLRKLIRGGHVLHVYRGGRGFDDEPLTSIEDIRHLNNFLKTFKNT